MTNYKGLIGTPIVGILPKPYQLLDDGYDRICAQCNSRWGKMVYGEREVSIEKCPTCIRKAEPVHPKNFGKRAKEDYMRSRPGTPHELYKPKHKEKNGKIIYYNIDHLL